MKLQCLPIYKYFLCDSRYIFSLEPLCWPQCINVTICVPKYAQILHIRLCYVFPISSWTFHTVQNIFTIYSSWLINMTKNEFLKSIRETQIKIKDYPPPLFFLSKLNCCLCCDNWQTKEQTLNSDTFIL